MGRANEVALSIVGGRPIENQPWPDEFYEQNGHIPGGSVGSGGSVGGDWGPVIPLGRDFTVPSFPLECLPATLREWVAAEAEATQTPVDLAAMLGLAVLAAVCAKAVEIEPKAGWREPTNLFVVAALDSGERKSAVFRDAVAPIEAYERALIEQMAPIIAERLQERRIAEKAVSELERKAAGDPSLKVEALSALRLVEQVDVPAMPRLVADDTTLEALTTLLVEQGGVMAVMAPEGKLFDIAAGIYSSKGAPVNHDVLLKGHAGETLRVDRKGREPEHVANAALTLGLAVQPYKIDDLVKVHGAVDSGLVARMLFVLPKSFMGWRNPDAEPVPEPTRLAYADLVLGLAERGGMLRESGTSIVLTLDAEATKRFREFRVEHETWLRPGARLSVISAWGSKLPGAVARIAALLHMAQGGRGTEVDAVTMDAALEIGSYLTAHALAVYDRAGADRVTTAARRSIDWLIAHSAGFTEREFYKDRFASAEEAVPVLKLLEEHGYIWRIEGERPGKSGGRPKSDRFEVNPQLLATEPPQPTQPPVVVSSVGSVGSVDAESEFF